MASGKLDVRVVSPSRTVFQGEAVSVVVPAWDGKVGILPGHAPYIALLGAGMLDVDLAGGGSERFFVRRGVLKVQGDEVTVLSEFSASEPPGDFSPGEAWLSPDEVTEDLGSG